MEWTYFCAHCAQPVDRQLVDDDVEGWMHRHGEQWDGVNCQFFLLSPETVIALEAAPAKHGASRSPVVRVVGADEVALANPGVR